LKIPKHADAARLLGRQLNEDARKRLIFYINVNVNDVSYGFTTLERKTYVKHSGVVLYS